MTLRPLAADFQDEAGPAEARLVNDLLTLKAELLSLAGKEADDRHWTPALVRQVVKLAPFALPAEPGWVGLASRTLPLFADYLAATGHGPDATTRAFRVAVDDLIDLGARDPVSVMSVYRLIRASEQDSIEDPTEWFQDMVSRPWPDREAAAGPVAYTTTDPSREPRAGVAHPRPLPSVAAGLAAGSPLLGELIHAARKLLDSGRPGDRVDRTWRLIVLSGLILETDAGLLAGPSLRRWDTGGDQGRADVWYGVMLAIVNQLAIGPEGVQAEVRRAARHCLVTANDTGRASIGAMDVDEVRLRAALEPLVALGAVAIDGDVLSLTGFGAAGLIRFERSAYGIEQWVKVPAWNPSLTAEDVAVALTAEIEQRASSDENDGWLNSWNSTDRPAELAERLAQAFPLLDRPARALGLTIMINLQDVAAPALRSLVGGPLDTIGRVGLAVNRVADAPAATPAEVAGYFDDMADASQTMLNCRSMVTRRALAAAEARGDEAGAAQIRALLAADDDSAEGVDEIREMAADIRANGWS